MWVETGGRRGVHVNKDGYCKLHDDDDPLMVIAANSGSPSPCKLLATEYPHHGEHRILPMSDQTEPSIFCVENLQYDKWDAWKSMGCAKESIMMAWILTPTWRWVSYQSMSLNYMSFETATLTSPFRNKALALKRRNKTWTMCCIPTLWMKLAWKLEHYNWKDQYQ